MIRVPDLLLVCIIDKLSIPLALIDYTMGIQMDAIYILKAV